MTASPSSPGLMSMGIPSLLAPLSPGVPLSPLEDVDTISIPKEEKPPPVKMEISDTKISQPPIISTDDESHFDPKPRSKPKGKKPSKSRNSGSGKDRSSGSG